MLRVIEHIVDGVTQVVLPSCVWGGEVITPGIAPGGNAGRTSPSFRLQMEVLEPRYALSVSVGPDPLAVEEPLDFDPALDADYELRAEGDAADQTIDNGQGLSVEASPASLAVFVVTSTTQNDQGTWDVYAQRQDAHGNPIADPIRVSETTAATPDRSSVAISDAGKFVVVWSRRDDEVIAIFARSYHADGAAASEEVQASETTLDDSQSPVAAIAEDGKFVVAWSGKSEPDRTAIFARPFDSSGQAVSDEIGVFSHAGSEPHELAAAINSKGQFAVAWSGTGPDEAEGVFVQQHYADGSTNGDVIQATDTTHVGPGSLELMIEDDGTVTVFWFDRATGTSAFVRLGGDSSAPVSTDTRTHQNESAVWTANLPADPDQSPTATHATGEHSITQGEPTIHHESGDDEVGDRAHLIQVAADNRNTPRPVANPARRHATPLDPTMPRVVQSDDGKTVAATTPRSDDPPLVQPTPPEVLEALTQNTWLDPDHGGEAAPVDQGDQSLARSGRNQGGSTQTTRKRPRS